MPGPFYPLPTWHRATIWLSDGFVSFVAVVCLFLFFVYDLKPYCNKSEAYTAAVLREGVDDGRAPLTRGSEEAAVTLYPVNSEYIVLERGC